MFNGHAFYKNQEGKELHLYIDVDLKSGTVNDFYTKGELAQKYDDEFLELKNIVLGKSIKFISANLQRSELTKEVLLPNAKKPLASMSLWLMNKAIEDYQGISSLNEQNDFLCLCFGVGIEEIKKQVINRPEFGLSQLIAETMATSACGRCKNAIEKTIVDLREQYGKIKGLTHSKSRVDSEGHWIKIKGLYPADLIIKLDELKQNWMKRENITGMFQIEIENIEGYHLWIKINPADQEKGEKILLALSDYWKSELGVLFFLHLSS